MDFGKPRFGYYFDTMKKTRGLFKLALRYCRNHIDELKADACAENLHDKDCRKFWSKIYKISNNKASSHINSIGDATGPQYVTSMWKDHFEKLCNSSAGINYRTIFEEKRKTPPSDNLIGLLPCLLLWILWLLCLNRSVENTRVQMVFTWKPLFMEVQGLICF